jgi:hypothetical protein
MKTNRLKPLTGLLLALTVSTQAEPSNPNTDWFSQSKYGVFIHFLPAGKAGLKQVEQCDVKALASQLEELGAGYLALTLGQNSEQVKAIRAALRTKANTALPKRLKRADSYFGIHFDFHAGPDCREIGRNTTPEMVEKIIEAAHPDYIQIDCKGHPGLSSYPTKVGNPAPGFVGDPLRVWREVTARRGVALYMHYSGVWDSEAIRQHPDWAAVNADGTTNGNATSFFGPYTDRLLIPQLRELAGDYDVDVSVNRLQGKLAVNLVTTSGPHWNTEKPLIESIEPVGPLKIAIRATTKPAKITLQPEGQPLAFEYRDGTARVTVSRLDIHSIVVVE